jgi:hypothetical protein
MARTLPTTPDNVAPSPGCLRTAAGTRRTVMTRTIPDPFPPEEPPVPLPQPEPGPPPIPEPEPV